MNPSGHEARGAGAADAASRVEMEDAFARVEDELGRDRHAVIDGERLALPPALEARDPEDRDVVLARFPSCGVEHLVAAVEAAAEAAEPWAETPWADRAHLLFEAAERVRRDRAYFAAWVLLEGGLAWEAAEAEVLGAVDALEGNAREAVRRGREGPGGEEAQGAGPRVAPLGPGVLLAPAERPFALALALASAALAAGNPVVLVPATAATTVGWLAFGLLERVGAPRGTIHFVPGPPIELGRAALAEERARFVALSAALDVGLPPLAGGIPGLDRRELGASGRQAIVLGPAALRGSLRPRALFDAFRRA